MSVCFWVFVGPLQYLVRKKPQIPTTTMHASPPTHWWWPWPKSGWASDGRISFSEWLGTWLLVRYCWWFQVEIPTFWMSWKITTFWMSFAFQKAECKITSTSTGAISATSPISLVSGFLERMVPKKKQCTARFFSTNLRCDSPQWTCCSGHSFIRLSSWRCESAGTAAIETRCDGIHHVSFGMFKKRFEHWKKQPWLFGVI